MPRATITSRGQLTIPVEVRGELGLKPGGRVDFVVKPAGEASRRPKKAPLASLLGTLHRPGQKPASIEDMHAGVVGRAAEDWDRVRSRKG